jgi:hypothetical protein
MNKEDTLWHPVKPSRADVDWLSREVGTPPWKRLYETIKVIANWGLVWIWFKLFWKGKLPS